MATDASGMLIHLDRTHSNALNLAVLQRVDATIESIIASASHVAVYVYSSEKKEWVKKNIEGALFIVTRTERPRYRLVVMNRLSRSNLVQDVTADVEVQVKEPYVLFRDKTKPDIPVYGVWCNDEADREAIKRTLNTLLKEERAAAKAKAAGGAAPAPVAAAAPAAVSAAAAPPADSGKALLSLIKPGAAAVAPAPAAAPAPQPSAAAAARPVPAAAAPAPAEAAAAVPSLNALLGIGAAAGARAAPQPAPAPAPAAAAVPAAAPPAEPSSAAAMSSLVASLRQQASVAAAAAPAPAPAPAPAAAATAGVLGSVVAKAQAAGGLGEVNVLLNRRQLAAVLTDLLADDDFVRLIHAKYMETAMRLADQ